METVILILFLETLSFLGIHNKVKLEAARARLRRNMKGATRLPLVDARMKKAAGAPSKMEKLAAKKITQTIRFIVGTQAFEYATQAAVNVRSEYHRPRAKQRLGITW